VQPICAVTVLSDKCVSKSGQKRDGGQKTEQNGVPFELGKEIPGQTPEKRDCSGKTGRMVTKPNLARI
jgi:hypothetical protein